ncbi:TIGR01777 family oxidoreductase [Neobacillus sp. 114]|uniref:TIGR01777 family oxidoreductase n=1 Tax=Neobacillus sp. 114 TaxID=3048535 RepID=UPI001C23D7F3|nr:TIGR01777 family oxidoreductase [Neobacillus sp. 114]MBU8918104.1 TIGR01777 family oxidoreductase [Bacillus sp. FJAT-29953]
MKIAIAGGTGFVGKALVKELTKNGHQVIVLTRKANQDGPVQYVQWLHPNSNPATLMAGTDVIINLAGESINSGRWTEHRKKTILNSRLEAVHELLTIMNELNPKPKAFINASAVGYYGTSLDKTFSEDNKGSGDDFLSRTVMEWEKEAAKATEIGIRSVFCRFGIILDQEEGALPKIALPYKSFIGGPIGTGKQWMSWIHIEDVVKAILFIIENETVQGPVNFTAPNPVTMNEFGLVLSEVLKRPNWLPVPSFALKTLLGEMSTLVIDGQKVLPAKLLESGYTFQYPDLKPALKNIFT